jgi:hypothetical protein
MLLRQLEFGTIITGKLKIYELHFIQPEIHIKVLSTQQQKITNNTNSSKYTTSYSKLDENHGTGEHIKVGGKVQRSDTKTKYTM